MKYKFCNIRINVTKCDVTFVTKGRVLTPNLPWLRHCTEVLYFGRILTRLGFANFQVFRLYFDVFLVNLLLV